MECNTSLCLPSWPLLHIAMKQLQAIWYVIEVTSQENSDVSSNVVQLVWMKHMTILDYDKVYDWIMSVWPIQRCSFHVCCPESYTLGILKPVVLTVADKEVRSRTLFHTVPESKILSVL